MKISEKDRKMFLTVLIVATVIVFLAGSTLAYFNWRTAENQKTSVTFTVEDGFSCSADGGGNIEPTDVDIMPTNMANPVADSRNYIKRTVTVSPKIEKSGKKIYMDLWLTINNIGEGLSNSDNFRYSFTTSGADNPMAGVISEGNFKGKKANDKVLLLEGEEYFATRTDTYYLWIWLDYLEESPDTMNQSFSLSVGGNCTDHLVITTNTLINRANPKALSYDTATPEQRKEMFTFHHDATEQTPETTDYRYIGNDVNKNGTPNEEGDAPNNYIKFNGNEDWRIIGVFDGHIKIMKDKNIGYLAWDYKKTGVGSSTSDYGSNDWTDSQLMYMLNPDQCQQEKLKLGYTTDGTYIRDNHNPKNIIYGIGKQPAVIAAGATSYGGAPNSWKLNDTAKSQIAEMTYYLGGHKYDSTTYYGNGETFYQQERGTVTYRNSRPPSWEGYVGLMYPSDYAYTFKGVDDTCYGNPYKCNQSNPSSSWMNHNSITRWTMSPSSDYAFDAFYVYSSGCVSNYFVNHAYGVQPVVYLISDIKLEGMGTEDKPYRIVN